MKWKIIIGLLLGVLIAGCQTAPMDNSNKANTEPEPKTNTEPANNTAGNTDPDPEPQPDPDVVKGQDAKEVIFVLGVDGMD